MKMRSLLKAFTWAAVICSVKASSEMSPLTEMKVGTSYFIGPDNEYMRVTPTGNSWELVAVDRHYEHECCRITVDTQPKEDSSYNLISLMRALQKQCLAPIYRVSDLLTCCHTTLGGSTRIGENIQAKACDKSVENQEPEIHGRTTKNSLMHLGLDKATVWAAKYRKDDACDSASQPKFNLVSYVV